MATDTEKVGRELEEEMDTSMAASSRYTSISTFNMGWSMSDWRNGKRWIGQKWQPRIISELGEAK